MNYEELLVQTALADERFVVMTAENRALVRSAPRLLGKRFVDTGITEQTMIGMAAGLALRGRIPVVHALAPFLTMRAFEFIRTDVGIAHLPVKLSGYIPGFLSDGNGPTHQAIEDVALMRNIRVWKYSVLQMKTTWCVCCLISGIQMRLPMCASTTNRVLTSIQILKKGKQKLSVKDRMLRCSPMASCLPMYWKQSSCWKKKD